MFGRVAKNTIYQGLAKATSVVFTLLITILLTGYLGKEGYGRYVYVLTAAMLLGNLTDWGTATIGVRELAKSKKPVELFGEILGLRLGLSLIVGGGVVAGWGLGGSSFLPWMAILAFLTATRNSLGLVFQARLQTNWLIPAEAASGLVSLGLIYFFVRHQGNLVTILAATAGAGGVAVLVNYFLARRQINFSWRFNWLKWRVLLNEAAPMGLILLTFTAVNKIDTLILAHLQGSAAVGVYGLSYRVYDVLVLAAAYVMNGVMPLIARNRGNPDNKTTRLLVKKTFWALLILGGIMVLVVLPTAPLIVKILTQKRFLEFSPAVGILRVLTLAAFLAYFNHLTGYTLVALGRQRQYLRVPLMALAVNILLNFYFIPRYSFWAAAWITVMTESLTLLISAGYLYRVLKK
ncbi:MAG: flippase [Candidatus Shapirobacteria bacterium]